MSVGNTMPCLTAGALVDALGGQLHGDSGTSIRRFSSLLNATRDDASFLANPRYQSQLAQTEAGVIILKDAALAREAGVTACLIETEDPYLYFARAATLLQRQQRIANVAETVIAPSAVVHPSAVLGDRVRIADHVVIGPRCVIGSDTDIGAGCILDEAVQIGSGALLHARVTVYSDVHIGDRAVIHSGVVIGADGFGFAPQANGAWLKIPQVGGVRIGDDVEIGANTAIDRGTLEHTVIGHGVKLDNQIQIAHNVRIGDHTAMAACVGVAGSAVIGAHCQIGGAAGILGHLSIADGTIIGPMSLVTSTIAQADKYVGVFPLQTQGEWEKSAAIVRRLPELRQQVRTQRRSTSDGSDPERR